MSSTQWEVVTKSKKQKNLEKKLEAHTEKKRVSALGPKLEDILPSHQYRNLISGGGGGGKNANKELNSAAKPTNSSSKSKSPKKAVKSNASAKPIAKEQSSKKQQQPQSKPQNATKPKSLEAAIRAITPEDFLAHLEQLKLTYPGSELLWLKGIASYLNTNLSFDCDPTFSSRSIHYPTILAGQPIKTVIVDFLRSVGEENLSYFYHTLLISMATELSKHLPILGYKFLLQLIGQNWPQICSNNMAKSAMLLNSYQNRSNICLSILWAIGQGGYQKLVEGVKVWQNLMLPHVEMKSYSKFVSEYIERILNTSLDQSLNLNQNEFFTIFNTLKSDNVSIPKECREAMVRSAELFVDKYINSSSKHANIFLTLFRDIENSNTNVELNGSLSCLIRGADCFKIWKMNYKKQLQSTLLLLQKIDKEIDGAAAPIATSETFREFLQEATRLNAELELAKKKSPYLDDLIAVVKAVQEKSSQQKKRQNSAEQKKCGYCRWMFGSLVLIGLIAAALMYDTEVNGKGIFEKSATGKMLKNAGLLPHVQKGWYNTLSISARGYKWAEKHVPPYAKPVGQLACDFFKLSRNIACNTFHAARDCIAAKLPVVANFLEQYIPGLPKAIENTSIIIKDASCDVWSKTVHFFRNVVFVGNLSPENLNKALNNTQNLAIEYYNLFHKKVDAYAKLK